MTSYPPPPPPPSGPSGPGQPYYAPRPADHPKATTALVLGILALVLCQILGPFAWSVGGKAVKEIDASGGALGGRGSANAGRILGIIATVLLVLSVLVVVGVFAIGGVARTSFDTTCETLDQDGAYTVACD